MNFDWFSAIVGALIGFASSVGIVMVERALDHAGKISIFCKIGNGDETFNKFSSLAENGKFYLVCPVKFEIVNASNTQRVMRDVSLNLYNKGRFISSSVQVERVENEKMNRGNKEKSTKEYGDDQRSYSFVIPPRSICRETCCYIAELLITEDCKYDYDELRISYYTEHNRKKEYVLTKLKGPWESKECRTGYDWVQVNSYKHTSMIEK